MCTSETCILLDYSQKLIPPNYRTINFKTLSNIKCHVSCIKFSITIMSQVQVVSVCHYVPRKIAILWLEKLVHCILFLLLSTSTYIKLVVDVTNQTKKNNNNNSGGAILSVTTPPSIGPLPEF